MGLPQTTSPKNSHSFHFVLARHSLNITPISVETIQLTLTRLCNQACTHCKIDASPERTEHMELRTVEACLGIAAKHDSCKVFDLTGGAPKLSPHFNYLVAGLTQLKKRAIVRTNITVMFDGNPQTGEKKTYLPEFFATHRVEVIASLPDYREHLTDGQRGRGVFQKSIEGIRKLNALGYGKEGTGLVLNLVHNPAGACLPGDQESLEAEFKRELLARYGIVFNKLYSVTNVPVNRFRSQLERLDVYHDYMCTLANAFNPVAAERVQCRSSINIGYDGHLYDCDFNQMLGMPITQGKPLTAFNFDFDALMDRRILFGPHCFGCTAGSGRT